ncbi:unnamed protein product [Urochloa decumbens]|uniref:Radical SAM core domain-containing protein n=1 Tax=Urochloa decumbens TaxID=240449 RepID=A0ABC8Y4P3_9POAL
MASSSAATPSRRSVFDAAYIRSEFSAAGISTHFIPLIWKYVLQNPWCGDLDGVPSLPATAYALLQQKFRPTTSTLTAAADSKDRTTTKLLIRLQNGESVESVIMRYDTTLGKYDGKPRSGGVRATLCVSSQVGCKMGCRFCATGTMGFKSNLSSGEIVEQLGMGEPMNNYNALVEAIGVFTGSPFQLSPKRITVSTVGIIHAINKFNGDLPNVNLAVSLHAPDQDIRCQIMPAARAFPLGKLMNALQSYQNESNRTIFIEYIMLDGVNDQEEHAHQLGKLLETFKAVVNLIPFNPIGSSSNFKTSSDQNVKKFQKVLRGIYNIRTTVRQEMGQDIAGACGQLVVSLPDERSSGDATLLSDIEDLRI